MSYGKLAKGISEEQARKRLQQVMPVGKRMDSFKGSSPPAVFVGSSGYPKLNTGILSPQSPGNSTMLDSPQDWYENDMSVEKVASLRTSLVNSRKTVDAKESTGFVKNAQEVAMARKPVDMEIDLEKSPGSSITGGRAKPVSASGELSSLKFTENPSVDRKVEDMFYDRDARAETAVHELFDSGVEVYRIQQSLTAGMLGEEDNREIVPTRWSITATDDMTSKRLRDDVRTNQELGEVRYFTNSYVGNNFHTFLIPGRWEFELIELKRSGSVWNSMKSAYIASNHEPFTGRTSYAEQTAGAYYASRLAALEYLYGINRQAKVLTVREVTTEYWAPLGVWVVRETARGAFDSYSELESMKDVHSRLSRSFTLQYPRIKSSSKILEGRQAALSDFAR